MPKTSIDPVPAGNILTSQSEQLKIFKLLSCTCDPNCLEVRKAEKNFSAIYRENKILMTTDISKTLGRMKTCL